MCIRDSTHTLQPGNDEGVEKTQPERQADPSPETLETDEQIEKADSKPGCSHWDITGNSVAETCNVSGLSQEKPSIFCISPEQIIPIPHVGKDNITKRKRHKGKTTVITSSPYKTELQKRVELKEKSYLG